MIAIDYVGVATLVTAFGAAAASILAVVLARPIKQQTNDIHAAVTTSNGHTLGEVVERIDARAEATEKDLKEGT